MKEYLSKLYKNDKESFYKLLSNDLKKKNKRFIVTVNPETLMISEKDKALKNILDKDYSFVPDGIAVVKACKKLNISVKERIPGIEIAEFLIDEANNNNYSIYLFGAEESVVIALKEKLENLYANINVIGYSNGFIENKDKVMEEIVTLKPDICMVALGIPEQEKIIDKYFDKFDKGIFIGVGGSFDILSGTKKRAPEFFIKHNLEWLYRIIKEPKRLKRFYQNNIKFMFKIKK